MVPRLLVSEKNAVITQNLGTQSDDNNIILYLYIYCNIMHNYYIRHTFTNLAYYNNYFGFNVRR